jgi:hypothetical protein
MILEFMCFLVILSDLRVVGFFQLSAMAFRLLSWIDSCITYLFKLFLPAGCKLWTFQMMPFSDTV